MDSEDRAAARVEFLEFVKSLIVARQVRQKDKTILWCNAEDRAEFSNTWCPELQVLYTEEEVRIGVGYIGRSRFGVFKGIFAPLGALVLFYE